MPGAQGTLGQGNNRAFIYARGGSNQLLPLAEVSALDWGRAKNAFSTSTVTVSADDSNYKLLGDVHTWAHELVIFRDGARVWEGPIRYIDQGKSDTILYGVDVLGWLKKRAIRIARQIAEGSESSIITEMQTSIENAFAADDPNVLAYLFASHHSAEAKITRDVAANSGMYDGDLTSMAGQGGNFVVLGRRVILYPDEMAMARLNQLDADRHTTAEVRVVEDGDSLATFAIAVNSDGLASGVIADNPDVNGSAVSTFYGRHDTIVSANDVGGADGLTAIARSAVADLYPAPLTVVMPADSQLKASAPFPIEQLVPGALWPVETSSTGRVVSTMLLLDSMKCAQDAEGGEAVTVSLTSASAYSGIEDEG